MASNKEAAGTDAKEAETFRKIERDLYPLSEARQLLGGVSTASLYRWEAEERIKLVRICKRVFMSADEIARITSGGAENKAA